MLKSGHITNMMTKLLIWLLAALLSVSASAQVTLNNPVFTNSDPFNDILPIGGQPTQNNFSTTYAQFTAGISGSTLTVSAVSTGTIGVNQSVYVTGQYAGSIRPYGTSGTTGTGGTGTYALTGAVTYSTGTVMVSNGYGQTQYSVSGQNQGSTAILIASASYSTPTVTITTAYPHGYATGDLVTVKGLVPSGYNGEWTITVTGPLTFTYSQSGLGALTTTTGNAYQLGTCTGTFSCYQWVTDPTNSAVQVLQLEYDAANYVPESVNALIATDRTEITPILYSPYASDYLKNIGTRWYAFNFFLPSTLPQISGGLLLAQVHGNDNVGQGIANPVFSIVYSGAGKYNSQYPGIYGSDLTVNLHWDSRPACASNITACTANPPTSGNSYACNLTSGSCNTPNFGTATVDIGPAITGQWYLVVMKVTWSNAANDGKTEICGGVTGACTVGQSVVAASQNATDSTQGNITVWVNGVQVWNHFNAPNDYDTWGGKYNGNYSKTGMYMYADSATLVVDTPGSGGSTAIADYVLTWTGGSCSSGLTPTGSYMIAPTGTVTTKVAINSPGYCYNPATQTYSYPTPIFGTANTSPWNAGSGGTGTPATGHIQANAIVNVLTKGVIEANGNATYSQVVNQFNPPEFGSFVPTPVVIYYAAP